jgi:serine-type D-Ala-D-Ala carboxypeptidase
MAQAQPQVSEFLSSRIEGGDFPSAVYLVGERGSIVFTDALGDAVVQAERIKATVDTVYDLASLTKPLITTFLCAKRIEAGELSLDDLISLHLLEFDRPDKRAITLKELLTHSSGLPAWRPLYVLAAGDRSGTLHAIANEPLDYTPGTRVLYSDLGFITLGLMLERRAGKTLAELAQQEIFSPLHLDHTWFNPLPALQSAIAASELGNAFERETCQGMQLQYDGWRDRLVWGEVHDGNCYFLGGEAGHAGLFSTAIETFQIANQFIAQRTMLFEPATCELFQTNFTAGMEEDRSIGWKLASSPESSAGPDLPPASFGHAGFTGTSCWIDGERERVFILLTNRTHARALPFANINEVRRRFHSLAVAAL